MSTTAFPHSIASSQADFCFSLPNSLSALYYGISSDCSSRPCNIRCCPLFYLTKPSLGLNPELSAYLCFLFRRSQVLVVVIDIDVPPQDQHAPPQGQHAPPHASTCSLSSLCLLLLEVRKVSYLQLYRYADKWVRVSMRLPSSCHLPMLGLMYTQDVFYVTVGALAALAHGALQPLFIIFIGDIVDCNDWRTGRSLSCL